MSAPLRPTPPWLFGILVLPFGAAVGFLQVAVPFWLRAKGISLVQIGAISATGFAPHALKIFWVPLIDLGPWRKVWYLTAALATGVLLAASAMLANPAQHLALFTLLITGAQAAAATTAASLNALMATTTRAEDKGRAGGFYMAGNLGGTGVLGSLALKLADVASGQTAGLTLGAICVGSSLCGLGIVENTGGVLAARGERLLRFVGARLVSMFKDVLSIVLTREGLTGLLICLAPVGCGALSNLFTAFAQDYRVSADMTSFVSGIGGGIAGAVGSVLGGYLADRFNRRFMYCLAGALSALCAGVMSFAPVSPATYVVGTLLYLLANGFAFAAFAGFVLEMVSKGAAVSTKYALFVASSNFSINYTTYLDGRASAYGWLSHLGSVASIKFDALITFAGVGFVAVMTLVSRRLFQAPAPVPSPVPSKVSSP